MSESRVPSQQGCERRQHQQASAVHGSRIRLGVPSIRNLPGFVGILVLKGLGEATVGTLWSHTGRAKQEINGMPVLVKKLCVAAGLGSADEMAIEALGEALQFLLRAANRGS